MLAFWLVFAVAAVVLVLYMVKAERRRRDAHVREYQAAASKLGASYAYDPPGELLSKLEGFDLTFADGAGLPNAVRDVFTADDGTGKVSVFLHEHRGAIAGQVGGGVQRESSGCVVSNLLQLPRLRLIPERPVEKIASLLGWRDVDFDSHPGFSAAYYLYADDEAAVRRLFQPKVLNFFENNPGLHVEGRGDTLLVYRRQRAVSLDELPAFISTVREIAELLKPPR